MALKRKKLSSAEESDIGETDTSPQLKEEVSIPAPTTLSEIPSNMLDDHPSMKDFEADLGDDKLAPFAVSALGTAFETVVTAIQGHFIPDYELRKLLDVLPAQEDSQEFGADFDMSQELTNQLQALQAVRNKIFSSDGRLAEGQTIKEAKDFMSSSATLLQLLQKSKSEFINIERLQAIEEATIDTIKELGEDKTKLFLNNLKDRLEKIK